MEELLTDFEGLKKHIKGSDLKFQDAIKDYFRKVGEKQGFTVVENSQVIRKAVDFGKVELVWVEPNVVFCMEFGTPDEIYKHLFRVMTLKPSVAVMILSGNSACKPKRVKEIVEATKELSEIRFLFLDVSENKLV